MGREIRRVPVDFSWPLKKVWHGFLNPHYDHRHKCRFCDGGGYNRETRQIADAFYDSDNFGVAWTYDYGVDPSGNPATSPPWRILGRTIRWVHDITQDEVQALVDAGRLMDFTHNWSAENGWVKKDPVPFISASEVNEWSQRGVGHDAINRGILIKARATRIGVYGLCDICNGDGEVWDSPKSKRAAEEWEPTPPPTGDGYQIWETVSEGSPVSPVFATKRELYDWLRSQGHSPEACAAFVTRGWVPSMVTVADGNGSVDVYRDIESAALGE